MWERANGTFCIFSGQSFVVGVREFFLLLGLSVAAHGAFLSEQTCPTTL